MNQGDVPQDLVVVEIWSGKSIGKEVMKAYHIHKLDNKDPPYKEHAKELCNGKDGMTFPGGP